MTSERCWEEMGSFSSFLGNIPYNILLSSEDLDAKEEDGVVRNSGGNNGSKKAVKREKYGVRDMLPAFSYVRDYYNAKKRGCGKSLKSNENEEGSLSLGSSLGTKEPSSVKGASRNDLEERLSNKIQELRRNRVSKTKCGKRRGKADSSKDEKSNDTNSDSELEFGRIKTIQENHSKKNQPLDRGCRIKRINKALGEIKREEEALNKLPEKEREARIREIAMNKAIKKAQGIKVKDNKAKLIKSKKQIQAKKRKSKERWDEIKKKSNK